ncbi:MAG: hypothetical protein AB7U61_00645 [Methylocystis sp.]
MSRDQGTRQAKKYAQARFKKVMRGLHIVYSHRLTIKFCGQHVWEKKLKFHMVI